MGKTKITQAQLRSVLARRLKLKKPVFYLETHGAKISGSIVSDTFDPWDDARRQQEIWDALNEEYGSASVTFVGVMFAYTNTEWDVVLG